MKMKKKGMDTLALGLILLLALFLAYMLFFDNAIRDKIYSIFSSLFRMF